MKISSCFKDFVRYSSLNVLGMIGLSCYILADTFFVAMGLGTNGLAALNLAIPIYSFIHGIGLMIGIGGGTKYSILKSKNDSKSVNKVFTNAIIVAGILSVIFFFIGLFGSNGVTTMLGANEAVFDMSRVYLQMILLFSPMFILNNVLLCFVRNDGAPGLSMVAMIVGSLSNVVLDYLFIFPLKMGIFGAVLATGLSPVISMIILSSYFIKKKNYFKLVKCKISLKLIFGIFSSGLPSLITEMSSGIVIIVFNMLILKMEGNVGVAAYGVIANLSLVVMALYTGIAQGIQPLLSKNYGIGNAKNLKSILHYALITAAIISAIVYTCVFFGASEITRIFNSEQDPLLQSIAINGLKYYFTACVFAGFNVIISVYFTSTEHAMPAHIVSLLRGFIIILPMAFLLSSLFNMTGIWLAFPITELLVSVTGFLLYRKFKYGKREVA